ncbi:MAG: anhydro-N-acetylmuramic acid kinase [Bacteroidales bacterium]|nr:anhydro-N-acetylmuramic acid kinase [Bacteroidales bacterium]MCF8455590.1 anhydro-N-acetylmuramic acid kinase [Bacteroidales bacterium]
MYILGIMSGTSLDGIDLALCSFSEEKGKSFYEIHRAKTIGYPEKWQNKLANTHQLSAFELLQLHKEYGFHLGFVVNNFLKECTVRPEYIASHGHTVFHQPRNSVTFQLGDGAAIAARTGLPVISDFRNQDVCLGGQGAPLVPIGDELLFPEFDYCLNLGGFANVSFKENGKRIAFDICPVNIVLNEYARKAGKEFDKSGQLGSKGKINKALVDELDQLKYYQQVAPKSLGREWVEQKMVPILQKYNCSIEDTLASLYEHISNQLAKAISKKRAKILITGGGAYNDFLIDKFFFKNDGEVLIPDDELINFKEALIFAFLGYRFVNDEVNCLASVTGASRDSIGGCLFK